MTAASSPDRSTDPQKPDVLFRESHWLTWTEVWVFIAVLGPALGVLASGLWEDPEDVRRVALGLVGTTVLLGLIAVSPLTTGFRHIHIDESGLTLWWARYFHLPADQIGDVIIVPEEEAGPAALRHRYGGLRIAFGRCTYAVRRNEGPAVLVEQHRPDGKIVGWLLSTRDPAALIAALETVRRG